MTKERSSKTYQVPDCCCSCLGLSANKRIILYGGYQYDYEGVRHTTSFDLKVPICSDCKKAINQKRLIGFLSIILVGVGGWFVGSPFGGEYHIWGAIAGVIVGIIIASVVFFSSAPGEIANNGRPKFKNREFHKRFIELNRISPESYEAAERLDPRIFDEAEKELKHREQYADEFARSQREAKALTDNDSLDSAEKSQIVLAFGDGTSFLRFTEGMESQYLAHLRLTEHLKAAGIFPELSVCGMIARPDASCSRLIVVTGSTDEIARLPQVFYTAEAEEFVNDELGGDWSAATPASTISNVGETGMAVDLGPYNEISQEIRQGGFEFDKTLW